MLDPKKVMFQITMNTYYAFVCSFLIIMGMVHVATRIVEMFE